MPHFDNVIAVTDWLELSEGVRRATIMASGFEIVFKHYIYVHLQRDVAAANSPTLYRNCSLRMSY